ncbi:hypothetical protein HPB52_007983 [Rhipicephalus sanguineus]|uniref:Uncharacterized protein n=1 Tax=Rhipicephalus sanguineus TaxID=34632 RepID=A0A9D4T1H0_RHISA|nr:hypothetical protein HPB52_007983 [Rhipicephalus sanguineus]
MEAERTSYSKNLRQSYVTLNLQATSINLPTTTLAKPTRNTSPGKDRVTSKHLRQLLPRELTPLLRHCNDCWIKGGQPIAWKHSEVIRNPTTNVRAKVPSQLRVCPSQHASSTSPRNAARQGAHRQE